MPRLSAFGHARDWRVKLRQFVADPRVVTSFDGGGKRFDRATSALYIGKLRLR